MPRSPADRLAAHRARYHRLAEAITEIGFIQAGSIAQVYNRCGKANCRCHGDPPRPHGPYWQWTAKVDGKTVTRRLTTAEADLYRQWIDYDRRLRALITKMREISASATPLIMKEALQDQPKVQTQA